MANIREIFHSEFYRKPFYDKNLLGEYTEKNMMVLLDKFSELLEYESFFEFDCIKVIPDFCGERTVNIITLGKNIKEAWHYLFKIHFVNEHGESYYILGYKDFHLEGTWEDISNYILSGDWKQI